MLCCRCGRSTRRRSRAASPTRCRTRTPRRSASGARSGCLAAQMIMHSALGMLRSLPWGQEPCCSTACAGRQQLQRRHRRPPVGPCSGLNLNLRWPAPMLLRAWLRCRPCTCGSWQSAACSATTAHASVGTGSGLRCDCTGSAAAHAPACAGTPSWSAPWGRWTGRAPSWCTPPAWRTPAATPPSGTTGRCS